MKKIHFKTIDSTSLYVLRNFDDFEDDCIISADHQTSSIGSKQRIFYSYDSCGLYFNLILINKKPQNMTFLAAIAIVKALEDFGVRTKIKWINDICYNNKKIAGILVHQKDNKFSIGIGINLYKPIDKFNETIANKAGYLFDKKINKNDLLDKIVANIYQYMDNEEEITYEYKLNSLMFDKLVYVNGELIKVIDICKDGTLLIEKDNKTYKIDDINNKVEVGDLY